MPRNLASFSFDAPLQYASENGLSCLKGESRWNPHTYTGFERVANDQRGTPGIPRLAKWRPPEFLVVGQPTVELDTCFCNFQGMLEHLSMAM